MCVPDGAHARADTDGNDRYASHVSGASAVGVDCAPFGVAARARCSASCDPQAIDPSASAIDTSVQPNVIERGAVMVKPVESCCARFEPKGLQTAGLGERQPAR